MKSLGVLTAVRPGSRGLGGNLPGTDAQPSQETVEGAGASCSREAMTVTVVMTVATERVIL